MIVRGLRLAVSAASVLDLICVIWIHLENAVFAPQSVDETEIATKSRAGVRVARLSDSVMRPVSFQGLLTRRRCGGRVRLNLCQNHLEVLVGVRSFMESSSVEL